MAVASFKDYISGTASKTGATSKSSKVPSFSDYLSKQPPAPPTMSFGSKVLDVGKNIAAGFVKPFAELGTSVLNAGQIAIDHPETKPFSGSFLGDVEGLGKVDVSKSPFDSGNIKTIQKSAGVGAEIGATLAGGGAAEDAAGGIIKPTLAHLAKEGAVGGGFFGLGASLENDAGLGDTVKNTLIGAGTGAVLAPVLSRGLSYLGKTFGKAGTEVAEKAGTLGEKTGEVAATETPKFSDFLKLAPEEQHPNSIFSESYGKKMGYEPYPTNIPTIEAGNGRNGLPTIQTADPVNPFPGKIPGLKYESIVEPKPPVIAPPEVPMNTNIPETRNVPTASVPTSRRLPSIKGDKPTSEAIKISEGFVKQGLAELTPEEMAHYKGFNEAEQISKVTDYMAKDPEGFKTNVANGRVPKDVIPQIAYNAVKRQAIAEGDIETQRLLARNPITTQRSLAASTLRASQTLSSEEAADPISLIAKNDKVLEEKFLKKNGVTVEQAVQKEVKVAMEKKPKMTVKDFISNIPEC